LTADLLNNHVEEAEALLARLFSPPNYDFLDPPASSPSIPMTSSTVLAATPMSSSAKSSPSSPSRMPHARPLCPRAAWDLALRPAHPR
jgi:hypothetical protein